jgi:hypothetical protein
MGLQKPMQPESVASRFITTDHRHRVGQTKAFFRLSDLMEHTRLVARGHTPLAGFLARARGEAELPGFFTQFEGHKQSRLAWGIMRIGARFRGHELSPL